MQRWLSKILAAVACFILPMVCTLLPHILSGWCVAENHSRQRYLLSRLMCLGGGIFFGTYLLHMGPDVRHILDQALLGPYHITYPLTELLTGVGFFIVLFTETLVIQFSGSHKSTSSIEMREVEIKTTEDGAKRTNGQQQVSTTSCDVTHLADIRREQDARLHPELGNGHVHEGHSEGHSHEHIHNARSMALVLALSLHRIFEGMSVGLQQTAPGVGNLLLAVMCHETVIAFSLGLQFVRSQLPIKRLIITCLVCSIIMPGGVIIGIAMSENSTGDANQLSPGPMLIAVGVLQAIAVGTFIYVTFFEILSEELTTNASSLSKVVFVAIGFMLMALLDLVPEEQLQLQPHRDAVIDSSPIHGLMANVTL